MKRYMTIKFLGLVLLLATFIAGSTGCGTLNQFFPGVGATSGFGSGLDSCAGGT